MPTTYGATIRFWNGTDYDTVYPKTLIANVTGLATSLAAKENTANKGVANGYCPLGSDVKIPISYLSEVIIDGLNRIGAIAFANTTYDIDDLIASYATMAHGTATAGDYWYVSYTSATATLSITEDGADDRFFNPTTGAYDATSVNLTAGDWLVFDGLDSGVYRWTVIHNFNSNLYALIDHTHTPDDVIVAPAGVAKVAVWGADRALTYWTTTTTELGYLDGVTSSIQSQINGKAPTSHASSGTSYGVGTTSNYGHAKIINGLTQGAYADGEALAAYQGKLLKDYVDAKAPISHAVDASTYGLGTNSAYGHVKLIANLTQVGSVSGYALDAGQGKILKDAIDMKIVLATNAPTSPNEGDIWFEV